MYEEVGRDDILPPPPITLIPAPAPVPAPGDELYVEDVDMPPPPPEADGEDYEDPDAPVRPPPPPIKSIASTRHLPPPPPVDTPAVAPPPPRSPVPPTKVPNTQNQEPELIEEDVYDEAMSVAAIRSEPQPLPSTPELPPANKRPTRGLPNIPLPPTPVEKTKIKVNILFEPREDFENLYLGKWDCTADGNNELSFKKGETVYVISRQFEDKSWWVGECHGRYGLVPMSYLTPAFTPVVQ